VIVLDTTVLVYAVGDDHALRDPARALLAAAADGSLRATTTPEAIQEFAHVRARRDRRDAAALAGSYADLLSPLLEVGEADLREGLLLFERSADLGAFDAVLAAMALRAGATALVSADRAFAAVRGLRCVDLATAATVDLS
jgi:predicted nucleic acid-binding protein